jgi:murein DD-endopeptidase MepM/ murein hydrolase activator NlpD
VRRQSRCPSPRGRAAALACALAVLAVTDASAHAASAVAGGVQAPIDAAAVRVTGGTLPAAPAAPPHGKAPLQLGERMLRLGARGSDVVELQRDLTMLRLRTQADGVFGRKTERSVARFQATHHLRPNAVVDRRTAAAILAAVAPPATAPSAAPLPSVPSPVSPAAPEGTGTTATDPAVIALAAQAGWAFPFQAAVLAVPPAGWSPDQGVDIATFGSACGPQAVEVAVDSGTIVQEGISGFGPAAPVLQLDHGPLAGRYVYYGHAEPALVPVGTHVARGEPIAEVGCGKVGISSGPHLELGISAPGGPTCCPSVGQTSPLVEAILEVAYQAAAPAQ